jgi:hypothetical protein
MSNIGEPVDAIEPVPVDVIDAVGSDLSDDDDVPFVERVPADGEDHDPLLDIANEDASLVGRKRGRQSSVIWELFTDDVNPPRKESAVCQLSILRNAKTVGMLP